MADQTATPKTRKLRKSTETARERATHNAEMVNRPKRLSGMRKIIGRPFTVVAKLPIWGPIKFIGRFIIPPYLRSSWREVRQVTWPNGKQTRQLTGAVIIFSVVFGLLVAAFDYGLDKLFKQVIIK